MEVEINTEEMIEGIIKIRQSIKNETLKLIKKGLIKTPQEAELVVLKTLTKLITRWLTAEIETIEEIAKEKTVALKFTTKKHNQPLIKQISSISMYN